MNFDINTPEALVYVLLSGCPMIEDLVYDHALGDDIDAEQIARDYIVTRILHEHLLVDKLEVFNYLVLACSQADDFMEDLDFDVIGTVNPVIAVGWIAYKTELLHTFVTKYLTE